MVLSQAPSDKGGGDGSAGEGGEERPEGGSAPAPKQRRPSVIAISGTIASAGKAVVEAVVESGPPKGCERHPHLIDAPLARATCLPQVTLTWKCECSGGEEVLASFLPHPFDHHHGHGKKRGAAVPEPEPEEGGAGAGALSDEAMVEKIFAAMDHDRERTQPLLDW